MRFDDCCLVSLVDPVSEFRRLTQERELLMLEVHHVPDHEIRLLSISSMY